MTAAGREPPPFLVSRRSPFGPVVVVWSFFREQPGIVRVLLSRPGRTSEEAARALLPGAAPCGDPGIDAVADRIVAFLEGDDIPFALDEVRLDLCTPFQRRVLAAEHAIPRGRVGTYRRIAEQVGNPAGARAVGTALSRNPFPVIIPCHRAVRSDGSTGGYQGGPAMKRTLLEMEGVAFDNTGRVVIGMRAP